MKKAIGMACAAGGAMFLMKKMFELGMQSGAGMMVGAINHKDPEHHVDRADVVAELKKNCSLKNAMFLSGMLVGQNHGDELNMELNKD